MAAGSHTYSQSSSTVVGYFVNAEDAHRAIHALLDDGFESSQIGAAFHTGSASGDAGGASFANVGKNISYPDDEPSNSGVTTSAANETAVTPALGGGSGTGMAGAGKPGPITGSDLSHLDLPHEIKSTLAHDQPGETPLHTPPGTGSFTEAHTHQPGWMDKLGHLFGGGKQKQSTGSDLVTEESQNFGTGEGHLGVTPARYSRPYSHDAFERSFSGMGVEETHSRHLAHRLGQGGAVVSVSVTGRLPEVEKIFERHNGVVRFESAAFDDSVASSGHDVAVFGSFEHAYPAPERVHVADEPATRLR